MQITARDSLPLAEMSIVRVDIRRATRIAAAVSRTLRAADVGTTEMVQAHRSPRSSSQQDRHQLTHQGYTEWVQVGGLAAQLTAEATAPHRRQLLHIASRHLRRCLHRQLRLELRPHHR